MRGKLPDFGGFPDEPGITPADAGKTNSDKIGNAELGDHPRGCGENPEIDARFIELIGSPPRMRGKHPPFYYNCKGTGITPADAGKTHIIPMPTLGSQDHPRGCGEN